MSKFGLSPPESLDLVLPYGSAIGDAIDADPESGYQLLTLKRSGKDKLSGYRETRLAVIEAGGRTQVEETTEHSARYRGGPTPGVTLSPAGGRAYGVMRRPNGMVIAQPLDMDVIGSDRQMNLKAGGSFFICNPGAIACGVLVDYHPNHDSIVQETRPVSSELEIIGILAKLLAENSEKLYA
jgi:hypothetical protein